MSKTKIVFHCGECGYQSHRWLGRCPDCEAWNSFAEEQVVSDSSARTAPGLMQPPHRGPGMSEPVPISKIETSPQSRFTTGFSEFDRVLGGGVVPGSVVLIGGDPGIGKSTLVLQAFNHLAETGKTVLYVSGEESPAQIKLRADRMGVASLHLLMISETCFETILPHIESLRPMAMVIDSIQTLYTSEAGSIPGSVTQVREVASRLMFYAKRTDLAVFIVGHVTKEGMIAGPRVLEHIVDTVLYLEGDKSHTYRILRGVKNRFGATDEIGLFEMKGAGLSEVANPSQFFLSERPLEATGSVVVASIEGTRPILIELQSLVSQSYIGMARRMALGVDPNRVTLLLAILEKRAGLHLADQDVFVNVVSGIKVQEPAIDLGILMAIASSFKEKPIDPRMVVMGEVGLAGEIRGIQHTYARVKEAEKMGFKRCLLPKRNEEMLRREGMIFETMDLVGVSYLSEALEWIGARDALN